MIGLLLVVLVCTGIGYLLGAPVPGFVAGLVLAAVALWAGVSA